MLVLLAIVANCVAMCLDRIEVNSHAEPISVIIYGAAAVVKITARGFVLSDFTYLKDFWNCRRWHFLVLVQVDVTGSVHLVQVLMRLSLTLTALC